MFNNVFSKQNNLLQLLVNFSFIFVFTNVQINKLVKKINKQLATNDIKFKKKNTRIDVINGKKYTFFCVNLYLFAKKIFKIC